MTSSRVVADAILAGSANAIIATDRGGVIQIWNAGAERIFGYTAEEATKWSCGSSRTVAAP